MNPEPHLRIKDGFQWESLDEGCLLYHEQSGNMITLNAAAEIVLSHCTGEFPLEGLLRLLQQEFGMPPEAAQTALRELEAQGVVEEIQWQAS